MNGSTRELSHSDIRPVPSRPADVIRTIITDDYDNGHQHVHTDASPAVKGLPRQVVPSCLGPSSYYHTPCPHTSVWSRLYWRKWTMGGGWGGGEGGERKRGSGRGWGAVVLAAKINRDSLKRKENMAALASHESCSAVVEWIPPGN